MAARNSGFGKGGGARVCSKTAVEYCSRVRSATFPRYGWAAMAGTHENQGFWEKLSPENQDLDRNDWEVLSWKAIFKKKEKL